MRFFKITCSGRVYETDSLPYMGNKGFALKGYYLFGKGAVITNKCW